MHVIRNISLALAALLATSTFALTSSDGGSSDVTVGDYAGGYQGFANTFNGYDSTLYHKLVPYDEVNCTPNGCDKPFVVWGQRDPSTRNLNTTDIINGFSFAGGMQNIDRSSDNGIMVPDVPPVLDPQNLADKELCLKECAVIRKAQEDNNLINYGKLKAKYTGAKWMISAAGALIGVMAPGIAKLPAIALTGGGAYAIAQEGLSTLLDEYDLLSKALVVKGYNDCKKNRCGG